MQGMVGFVYVVDEKASVALLVLSSSIERWPCRAYAGLRSHHRDKVCRSDLKSAPLHLQLHRCCYKWDIAIYYWKKNVLGWMIVGRNIEHRMYYWRSPPLTMQKRIPRGAPLSARGLRWRGLLSALCQTSRGAARHNLDIYFTTTWDLHSPFHTPCHNYY